jgi:hypothetical protein
MNSCDVHVKEISCVLPCSVSAELAEGLDVQTKSFKRSSLVFVPMQTADTNIQAISWLSRPFHAGACKPLNYSPNRAGSFSSARLEVSTSLNSPEHNGTVV